MKKFIIIGIICLVIDQLLKLLVLNNLILNISNEIIPSFFSLTYVQNEGAAFSILSGNRIFLILITLFALIFIYLFLIKKDIDKGINSTIYGVLYGGIVGNLIDRVLRGYVIDYLDFNIFGYNFPIFNFADICIVISIILVIILSIFRGKDNENNCN